MAKLPLSRKHQEIWLGRSLALPKTKFFSGLILSMFNETCTNVAIMDALHLTEEAESCADEIKTINGYPGLRCGNAVFEACKLTLSGNDSSIPLDIGAMPWTIHTRMVFRIQLTSMYESRMYQIY